MNHLPTFSERVLELDSLRALAAIGVLIFHLPLGFWFGASGVDLFFVLSGYLITSIILQNCHKKGFLLNFYARRSGTPSRPHRRR